MKDEAADRCVEVEMVGEVAVARFTREIILSGRQADAVAEQLAAVLAEPGRQRLLLDFAKVRSLSSNILGKLVTLNRAAEAAGGRLALCNLEPVIGEIFEVGRLTLILHVYPSEQEALKSFGVAGKA